MSTGRLWDKASVQILRASIRFVTVDFLLVKPCWPLSWVLLSVRCFAIYSVINSSRSLHTIDVSVMAR